MEVKLLLLLLVALIIFIRIKQVEANKKKWKLEAQLAEQWKKEEEAKNKALEVSDIDNMSGMEFENYICKLFQHYGFETRVTKGSGDFGVDIIAVKGEVRYAVQVKRQKNPVSRRAVSDAVAGKRHYRCNKAIVVTNNYFSEGARQLALSTECELADRTVLSEWILAYRRGIEREWWKNDTSLYA